MSNEQRARTQTSPDCLFFFCELTHTDLRYGLSCFQLIGNCRQNDLVSWVLHSLQGQKSALEEDPSFYASNAYLNSLVFGYGSGGQNVWLKSTILLVSSLSSSKSAAPIAQDLA
ncbi:MAG TPA: hypothetical protein DCY88_10100 [Cyanobacteria bacterium UBA11372]|nr:hypothetical protein [Cyanobacteria bacterium UBA11372]